MPNGSIPVPVAVKVVVTATCTGVITQVQISPTARVLSVFWLLEKPAERLVRVTLSGAPMVTLALVRFAVPVLLSVIVNVVVPPDSIVVAAAVMVATVLSVKTLTVT